jgi:16S rRNA (cytosine1402-N4)-methyltransferase
MHYRKLHPTRSGEENKMQELQHIPVALNRCINLLSPAIEKAIQDRGSALVIDATLGLGGHTRALLEKYSELRIIGFDRDLSAIAIARKNVSPYGDRLTIVHAIYDQIAHTLDEMQISHIDGALFDLGVSSMQLDEAQRGFAYSQDAPLDMRMDQSQGLTAKDVLDSYDRNSLVRILRTYGDEKFAPRIADNIIAARENNSLTTTRQLADLVKESIPAPARRTGGNPAKRTFQALRIEVNQELEVLERAIPAAMNALVVSGRIVVMSYQSLEDKIVKAFFTKACTSTTPRNLPVELPNSAAKFTYLITGSESATESEIIENPRAQSMRLRAIERVAA